MPYYEYCGPVMAFGKCISRNWKATTFAISEKKALSNFAYQYKTSHGTGPATKITLPGKIEEF